MNLIFWLIVIALLMLLLVAVLKRVWRAAVWVGWALRYAFWRASGSPRLTHKHSNSCGEIK